MTYLISYMLTHILIVTQRNSDSTACQYNAKGVWPAECVRLLAPEKRHSCTSKEPANKTHSVTQNLNTVNKIFLTRFTCPFITQVDLNSSLCLLRDVQGSVSAAPYVINLCIRCSNHHHSPAALTPSRHPSWIGRVTVWMH